MYIYVTQVDVSTGTVQSETYEIYQNKINEIS